MAVVLTVVVAIFVFGAVIFFHELGHFAMAKRAGIKVNEFAIGMGPAILKFGKGETRYALRLFPVGGFVSMEGEDEESKDARGFQQATLFGRVTVIIAGAVMNLLLGFLAMAVFVGFGYQHIPTRTIAETGPAAPSVLRAGDVIRKVGGRLTFSYSDIDYEFLRTQNGTFDIEVLRDGKNVVLEDVTFNTVVYKDPATGEEMIDENTGEAYRYLDLGFKVWAEEKNILSVIKEAAARTLSSARFIYLNLSDLVTGRIPINNLSGPVGIISEISKAVFMGWQPVVYLLALISINLGVVNMLPLPALDGGRTVLILLGAIRKKPVPQKYEAAINVAGLVLLLMLMVFISFNDVRRLL